MPTATAPKPTRSKVPPPAKPDDQAPPPAKPQDLATRAVAKYRQAVIATAKSGETPADGELIPILTVAGKSAADFTRDVETLTARLSAVEKIKGIAKTREEIEELAGEMTQIEGKMKKLNEEHQAAVKPLADRYQELRDTREGLQYTFGRVTSEGRAQLAATADPEIAAARQRLGAARGRAGGGALKKAGPMADVAKIDEELRAVNEREADPVEGMRW